MSKHDDNRGMMCVGEVGKQIPFEIKRIFYDYNNISSLEHRGGHANINSRFVFICVSGCCTIVVDDGFERKEFVLNDPSSALFVNNMVWKEMYDFSADSVLLVLSDCFYNPDEYIKDFNDYLKNRRIDN